MTIHCRDRFMEALRALIAEHDWRKGYAGVCQPRPCPTCQLIARLEEVKT